MEQGKKVNGWKVLGIALMAIIGVSALASVFHNNKTKEEPNIAVENTTVRKE